MSYDVSLYRADFLKKALAEKLGDWTKAEPFEEAVLPSIVAAAESEGFVYAPHDPAFEAFVMQRSGRVPGREYKLDNTTEFAELTVFPNSVTFSIPNSPRALAAIEKCTQLAKAAAESHYLGYCDPQAGEVVFP